MANYPQERAQDAVCQSHTGHMTGLWFLPARPLRLNTNEWMIEPQICAPSVTFDTLHTELTYPFGIYTHIHSAFPVPKPTRNNQQAISTK